MAFGNYNNNKDNAPTNTTYSPITFANPESSVSQTRFSISYFNRVMKISIAQRNNSGSNNDYATYDTDNQVNVYLSATKAKMLHDLILLMQQDDAIHNVCVELNSGLLMVSDGHEFGARNTCFIIQYASEDGHVNQAIYECKSGFLKGAYNYNPENNTFQTKNFDNIELDTFIMTLDEYYKASSYAIAASIMEASMYKRHATNDLLNAIAEKVGAKGNRGGNYRSTTFLSGDGSGNSSSFSSHNDISRAMNVPTEYQESTFADIASGL